MNQVRQTGFSFSFFLLQRKNENPRKVEGPELKKWIK
jgi:hypothetical protein